MAYLIKLFQNHSEYEAFVSGGTMVTPNVSHCIAEKDVHYRKKKFDNEYLTFEALESGTFTLTIGSGVTTGDVVSVSYSLDNGETWTTTDNVQGQRVVITTPTVNAGDEVLWKGNANRMANNNDTESTSIFSSTANFNARGNVMSLLYGDEFKGKVSLTGKNHCFSLLFRSNTKLNNAKNISLPATTLADTCYYYMFIGCTSLTVVPELPATTLASQCYSNMFSDCTSLTTAPELPATTLAFGCYQSMFYGCANLTTTPDLPATTLTGSCYEHMFNGCTSLTTAPQLPATTLANYCYQNMFSRCTNLTVVPELPATTLAQGCYLEMFRNCTSLTTASELPATTLAQYCYDNMFYGCASLTVAPKLPATTLAWGCYSNMFYGCTSLTVAPELPATTLSNFCYSKMFYGCTNLTVAPELPATKLSQGCYQDMFNGCTSFTTAPKLPATTLANQCYLRMFFDCTSLNSITCLAANITETDCTNNWVKGVAASGTFIKHPSMTDWTTGVNGIPEGWETTDVVPSENYLTFDIISGGTIVWKASTTATTVATISYSINGGEWTDITSSTAGTSFNVSDGDKVRFKGNNAGYSTIYNDFNTFSGSTASFNIEGNIMSLIDDTIFDYKTTLDTDFTFNSLFRNTNVNNTENLVLPATTLVSRCYYRMFYGCTSLTTAPQLPATTLAQSCYTEMFRGCTSLATAPVLSVTRLARSCYSSMFEGCTNLTTAPELPATTLTIYCYETMFSNCTSLTKAPELPATTLASYCYQSMFHGCTNLTTAPELPVTTLAQGCYSFMFFSCKSLTTAPELPATTLTGSCYQQMFNSCTNLTTAPELPATTLASGCYDYMFQGCTSLTTAPELPATTLANKCYQHMFDGCTSLTTAPVLSATTLVSECYRGMFYNCTSLNSITCFATDISADNCTTYWVGGVAPSGTFIKADGMNDWTRGSNGIPTNWTVVGYYESKPFTLKTDSGNDGVFTINKPSGKSIDYSTDNGLTWTTTSAWDESITASTILIKSTDINNDWSEDQGSDGISCSVNFHVEGNIMSLLYGDDFTNKYVMPSYAFTDFLRDSSNLTSAKNLILPATTLGEHCYYEMFEGCTSLTEAPELPATTLAKSCYLYMFYGCTSLTTAPELPATTLASGCYRSMFWNCTSLTTAPELPAIILVDGCYGSMFYGCTSLTTAPQLPAETLVNSCYSEMFSGCTSLNSITCLATDISASNCTTNWVNGVAASGTFIKNESMNSWTTGTNGIPTNWTVRDYSTISTSLVMYVDDFPEAKLEGESKETVMARQLNNSYECGIGNKYVYTGETITYNGNTYYLWEMSDDCDISSNVVYLLTTTDNFNTLYAQSLEDGLTNHFTSLVGRLDEDKEVMYSADEIGSQYELYLVKVIENNSALLRIWVDDFPEDEDYDEGSAQDEMIVEIEDPEGRGANPYEYLGETIVYNGNTYYLWQAVEGYNVDNSNSKYFATTTIDFNTLYSQSLEDDLTNHFTDAIGMFNDSKSIYTEQGELPDGSDAHYLVKVEDLS